MRILLSRPLACVSACLLSAALVAQQPAYTTAFDPTTNTAVTNQTGGAVLELPGIGSGNFILTGGGQFVQLSGTTARLTGRIESSSNINHVFLIDLQLTGRLDPASPGYPPPGGSPVMGLLPSAYVPSGPVDPTQFRYYTGATGTLTGLRQFAGAVVNLQLTGPAVQVGLGANNRNTTLGAFGEFAVNITTQPTPPSAQLSSTGNAKLVTDLLSDRQQNASHPMVEGTVSTLPHDRAMDLGGVGDDYLFIPIGGFTELTNGTAQLNGTLARLTQLDDKWALVLTLNNRLDPGQTGFPPANSPATSLLMPAVLLANGGPVDPAAFHYYTQATGTLTGGGINAGSSLTLATAPAPLPAFQVGTGANQANLFVGLFGQCAVTLVTQPTGRTIAPTGTATFHAVTSVPAVLPLPTLVASQTPTLPTLTDQGLVLQGNNLAWIESVAIDFDIMTAQDPLDWFRGYFRIIDNNNIEVHPQPGLPPGPRIMSVLNRIFRSNQLTLTLTAPTTPALFSERNVRELTTQHLLLHKGNLVGPVFSAIGVSWDLIPSVLPGLVTVGIGNQFQSLIVLPGSYTHDPITGIASAPIGPVPLGFAGVRWHFQAALLDAGNFVTPLPVSNIWTVDYILP